MGHIGKPFRENEGAAVVKKNEQGQAVLEYILMLSVVVTLFGIVMQSMGKIGLAQKVQKSIMGPFASAYQFGHVKAKGFEDGPEYHPRAVGGNNNFRIFITKRKN